MADRWYDRDRLGGLRRFALAITVLNVLGHLVLGFEQAWIQPFVGVGAAYATELALEWIGARAEGRPVRFLPKRLGGAGESAVDFLLSAHISGLAVSMLLYANQRLLPIAFAACVAIGSKSVFRVRSARRPGSAGVGAGTRHWFNPSNFGIATTLFLFPSVGIAPPYMFTENLGPLGDWLLPCVIVVLGSLLNARFTHRLPLVAAWVGGFALQGLARHLALDQPVLATWMPMTGVSFLLFTFYMVTDPATTPARPLAQVAFGLSVAAAYGACMALHVVFGLFFALVLVSTVRGLALVALAASRAPAAAPAASPEVGLGARLGPSPEAALAARSEA